MRLVLDQGIPRDAALDADFHSILAVTRASAPSVISAPYSGSEDAGDVVEQVQRVLGRFESELQCGCLVTVKARKITCHTLPVGGRD